MNNEYGNLPACFLVFDVTGNWDVTSPLHLIIANTLRYRRKKKKKTFYTCSLLIIKKYVGTGVFNLPDLVFSICD